MSAALQPVVARRPAARQMLDNAAGDLAMSHHKAHPVVVSLPPPDGRSVSASHRWYVVNTHPGRERKVNESLEAIGFGTFLPTTIETYTKRRYRWGRWYEETRKREVLAFPTYLFVCFDVSAPAWRHIGRVDHVRRILGIDAERPLPVRQDAMDTLMREAYDRAMGAAQQEAVIKAGVALVIKDGPFAGHAGACSWAKGQRVGLNLSILGRDTPAVVRLDQVEKAAD